jgi:hypothetical protein
MSKQELDLFKFPAGNMTQTSAGPTHVMRREIPNLGLGSILVFRKNSIRASRSDFLKPIFVMKSAEDGGASNRISGRNTMPMSALLRERT